MNFHAMNLGELQTEVLRKLWITTYEDTNGLSPDSSFIKYSKYRVDKKINKIYSDMVTMAKALRCWFILPLKANYSQYQVPAGVFDIEEVYYFTSSTSYSRLTIEEESTIEDLISPNWRMFPSIPEYAFVGDRAGMGIKLGIAPASKFNATAVTVAGGSAVSGPFGGVDGVYGSASPDSTSTTYVDANGQNFVELGIGIGLQMLNFTTNTKAPITAIVTTNTANDTIICTNSWYPGDEMQIFYGETMATITIGDNDATFILSPIRGEYPDPGITMAANNLLVRAWTQPVKLVNVFQYPEINPMFHTAIALGAAAELGKEEPPDSPEFQQAMLYEQEYNKALVGLTGFVAQQYKQGANLWSRDR